ncbi:MAG: SRPBCC family protein, partial [Nocardioides sp.]|nr:SRPBCC family protein [Nocardioides sp.]
MPPTIVSASTTIDAPPAAVFAILADPRQHQRIDGSGTVQGTVSGPERLTLGSEFGMDMKMGASYKIKNRVVEFDEDRLIAWRHKGLHRWRYELAPTPDGGT